MVDGKHFVFINKVFDSKQKAFADNKINVTQNLISDIGCVKNMVIKRENAGYHAAISLFLTTFQKASFLTCHQKVGSFGKGWGVLNT